MGKMIWINRTKVDEDLWKSLKYKAPLLNMTHEELLNKILKAGLNNIKVEVNIKK